MVEVVVYLVLLLLGGASCSLSSPSGAAPATVAHRSVPWSVPGLPLILPPPGGVRRRALLPGRSVRSAARFVAACAARFLLFDVQVDRDAVFDLPRGVLVGEHL